MDDTDCRLEVKIIMRTSEKAYFSTPAETVDTDGGISDRSEVVGRAEESFGRFLGIRAGV